MYLGGWMDTIRYLLIFFLFFSGTCFAGDYPASYKWPCKKTDYNTTSPAFSDSPIYTDYSQCIAAYNANKTNADFSFQATVYSGYDSVDFYNQGTLFQPHVVINIKQPYCPYGGSLSGTQCINAPECDAGYVRNATTGACEPPPPPPQTCPPKGEKRSLAVCKVDFQDEGGTLNIRIDGNTAQHTVNYDGCIYNYTAGDYIPENGTQQSGCYVPPGQTPTDGKYSICCSYDVTSAGEPNEAPDTADDSTQKNGSAPIDTNADGSCKTDSKGNEVCTTASSAPTQQCGTVNGTKVCVDSTDSTKSPSIDGKPTTPETYCTWSSGVLKCVELANGSPTTEGCVVGSDGRTYCVNRDVKETTEETTTTNPDGSITKTKIIKRNVIGDDQDTETTTTNPDGSTTTTKSGDDGQGTSDCEKNPNTLGCLDISKGDAPKADAISTIDVPIVFNPVSWGGSGSCPAPGTINLHGSTVEISYQPYCDIASAIRPIVIALAFMSAAYIVFGGVKE